MYFDANGIFIFGAVPLIKWAPGTGNAATTAAGRNMELRAHQGSWRADGAHGGAARIGAGVGARVDGAAGARFAGPVPPPARAVAEGFRVPFKVGWTGLGQAANGGRFERSSGGRWRRLTRDNCSYRESNRQFRRFPSATTKSPPSRFANRRPYRSTHQPVDSIAACAFSRARRAASAGTASGCRPANSTRDNSSVENRLLHRFGAGARRRTPTGPRWVRPMIHHRAPTRDAATARAARRRFAARSAARHSG